jgi:putative tryptophan/tyrosine transport system substrate-binding protein
LTRQDHNDDDANRWLPIPPGAVNHSQNTLRRRLAATAIGAVVTVAFFIAPLAPEAQTSGKAVPRVGYLGVAPRPTDEAFRQGLRDLGYVEGKNIIVEYRWAGSDNDAAARFVREMLQLNVDVMVTVASRATGAAKQLTSRTPIVMVDIGDPVAFGFVSNLNRPTGNVTGFSAAALDAHAKSVQLMKELVPGITRVATLVGAFRGAAGERQSAPGPEATLGLRLETQVIRTVEDFESVFAEMTKKRPDAMVVSPDHFLYTNRARIIEFVARNRLPTVYGLREYVFDGGLMSLAANRDEMFQRAAVYVDKLLKGAKPSDLPVQQPTKFELLINARAAKVLGLVIPSSLMLRADQIIE